MPLVTIMAREMRVKSTKLWRCCECRQSRYWREKCDRKCFEVDQALEMLRVPLVTIVAREIRLKSFLLRPNFGDVASAASHDIGARNAI